MCVCNAHCACNLEQNIKLYSHCRIYRCILTYWINIQVFKINVTVCFTHTQSRTTVYESYWWTSSIVIKNLLNKLLINDSLGRIRKRLIKADLNKKTISKLWSGAMCVWFDTINLIRFVVQNIWLRNAAIRRMLKCVCKKWPFFKR